MENASKALIIAGAILLSILLISLGIMIFTQAQDTIQNSGMSQAEVNAFNNQFVKYEGTKKGTMVKSMVQEVNTNNSQDESGDHQIAIVVDTADTTTKITSQTSNNVTTYFTKDIKNTSTYEISITKYEASGRISQITVKLVANK